MALAIAIFSNRIEAMLQVNEQPPRFVEIPVSEEWIDPETSLVWMPEKLGIEIRRVLKANRLYQKKAYVGIPGAIIRQTNLPLPFNPSKGELRVAVTTEAERYAVFNDCEALVDLISFGQEAQGIRVLFAAISKDVAESHLKTLAAAGITPLSLEPLSLAALRKIAAPLSHEATGLMIRSEKSFSIACLEEGRLQVWREIEALPPSDELAVEILRTSGQRRLEEWVLFGPSGEEAEFLSEHLQASVTWIDTDRDSHRFTGGLLIREGLLMDLRPQVEVKQSLFAKPQFWIASGMILGLVALLVGHFSLKMQLTSVEGRLQRLQQQISLTQQVAAMPSDPVAEARSRGVTAYQEGIKRLRLFNQLRDIMPADAWFTEVKIEGETFSIQGYALSQQSPAEMALALQGLSIKVNPPSVSREDLEGNVVYRFQIQNEVANGKN